MAVEKITRNHPIFLVNIEEFPIQAGKFCMSYGFDNSRLINSIETVGLINKPCVIKKNDHSIEIVTGYRRMLALKELGIKEVSCYDLTGSGMSDYELIMFALNDNILSRELSIIEKSMAINVLNNLVKDINIIYDVCSLINIHRKDYSTLLKINMLDNTIKEAISIGSFQLKIIYLLLQMEKPDILLISYWMNKLRLSNNYQIQFIEYINDISRIEKCSISSFMNEEYLKCLLADEKKNIPQKTKEIMDYLRIRRNPNISRYQEIFNKKIRKLNLPANVRVIDPRYFESEGYKLEISFNNGQELSEILMKLNDDKINFLDIKDPWLDNGL